MLIVPSGKSVVPKTIRVISPCTPDNIPALMDAAGKQYFLTDLQWSNGIARMLLIPVEENETE